jgi:hypothetical protein
MQALAAAKNSSDALRDGARYLISTQKGDGGWTLAGGVTNSQSTAWAVQGLLAAGGSGAAVSGGVSYLSRRQASDGHYAYSPSSDQTPVWVTAQAVTGVARKPFPLAAVSRTPKPSGSPGPGNSGAPGAVPAGGTGTGQDGARRGGGQQEGDEKGRDGSGPGSRNTGNGSTDGAPVAPETTDAPGTVTAEQAADEGGGLTNSAMIGIGLGGLAVLAAGAFVAYRRGL